MNFILVYLIIFTIALLGAMICYGMIIYGLIKEIRNKSKNGIILASIIVIITSTILVTFILKVLNITGGVAAWIS